MARRKTLISVSIVAHIALGLGVYVTGVWKLDRLDRDHRAMTAIGVLSPPAPSGAPETLPEQKLPHKPKPKVPPVLTQLSKPTDPTPPMTQPPGGGGETGSGNNPHGNPEDIGTCTDPLGCDRTTKDEPERKDPEPIEKKTTKTEIIPPNVMRGLRIRGETQIHPSSITQTQMIRDDHKVTVSSLIVCISTDGSVASVKLQGAMKYPEYEQRLIDAARAWQYRPYTVNGTPVPACSAVAFRYEIR